MYLQNDFFQVRKEKIEKLFGHSGELRLRAGQDTKQPLLYPFPATFILALLEKYISRGALF